MNYPEIVKYLEGKTTGSESEKVRTWLRDSRNETCSRKILAEIWTNSRINFSGEKPDFEILLKRISFRLAQQKAFRDRPVKVIFRMYSKAAAILLLPLLILTASYIYFNSSSDLLVSKKVSMYEIHTKPGTRTKIELSDGTMVWLNDKTTIKYPEYFKGDNRQVFVDGEAYFEVVSNSQSPFIVDNPIMKTIVTGTHFNIYAYSEDHFFEATLLEGKVHLEGQAGKIDLTPGQRIQYDATKGMVRRDIINPKNSVDWINGKLTIRNEKLESAVKKLSRWYDIEISISDPSIALYELTCTLENEKIGQCMNLISQALPVQYILKEEKENGKTRQKIQLMKK